MARKNTKNNTYYFVSRIGKNGRVYCLKNSGGKTVYEAYRVERESEDYVFNNKQAHKKFVHRISNTNHKNSDALLSTFTFDGLDVWMYLRMNDFTCQFTVVNDTQTVFRVYRSNMEVASARKEITHDRTVYNILCEQELKIDIVFLIFFVFYKLDM
ncbi:MAG: hypothetical protein IJ235_07210 [Eubacterium sp.]|nr:hypothetical protein [Eubacterium sp.]